MDSTLFDEGKCVNFCITLLVSFIFCSLRPKRKEEEKKEIGQYEILDNLI